MEYEIVQISNANNPTSNGFLDRLLWRQVCYNEHRVHDHDLYHQLNAINLYAILPLGLFGFLFNVLAIFFIYKSPKITSGVLVYLKTLLLLDFCLIVISLLAIFVPQYCDTQFKPAQYFYKSCNLERRFLQHLLPRTRALINCLHVWIVATLSAHRYWKITRPVVSRFKDTPFLARSILVGVFLAIFIFRLPTFLLELRLKYRPVIRISKNSFNTEYLSPYRLVYHSILDPMVSNLLPFLWMSAFSALTLFEMVRRHSKPFFSSSNDYAQLSVESNRSSGSSRSDQPVVISCGTSVKSSRRSSTTRKPSTVTAIRPWRIMWEKLPSQHSNSVTISNESKQEEKAPVFRSNTLYSVGGISSRSGGSNSRWNERRATVSILLLIGLYLGMHSLELGNLFRKWIMLLDGTCPSRSDYIRSTLAECLSIASCSFNAFVFIAFTRSRFIHRLTRKRRAYTLDWRIFARSSHSQPQQNQQPESNGHC